MAYSYKKTYKKGAIHTMAASISSAATVLLIEKGVPPEFAVLIGGASGGLIISAYDWLKKRLGLKLP